LYEALGPPSWKNMVVQNRNGLTKREGVDSIFVGEKKKTKKKSPRHPEKPKKVKEGNKPKKEKKDRNHNKQKGLGVMARSTVLRFEGKGNRGRKCGTNIEGK